MTAMEVGHEPPARAAILRVMGLFGQGRRDAELAAELESHPQLHIDDNLRAGMPLTRRAGRRSSRSAASSRRRSAAAIASYVPARRAAGADPMTALRAE